MTENLDHLDDLPKRDPNYVTEEKAATDFQGRLTESGPFILQRADALRHQPNSGDNNKIRDIFAWRPIGPNVSV
jgi:hypothetical protein